MENKTNFNKLIIDEEVSRCLLCYEAPCSSSCIVQKDILSIIMSLRFKNYKGAYYKAHEYLDKLGACGIACNNKMYCQRNCIRGKIDRPVKIRMIQEYLCTEGSKIMEVKTIE